jgi:Zinc finger C-x8-C-x5-C-x3-H type (and similar)
VKAHHQAAHGKFSGSGFKTITVAVPGCPVQRFRICVGNRPEDIAAWISDRKRRFPRSSTGGSDATRAGPHDKSQQSPQRPPTAPASPSPAQGLSSLLDGYGSSSDDESEAKVEDSSARTLVAQEDEAGAPPTPERLNDLNSSPLPKNQHPKRPCRFFARHGSCRNGESCLFAHDAANAGTAPDRNNRTGTSSKSRGRPSAPPSLLEKLLANDVRRERLLTIQLLEHIAYDANFFSQPEAKSEG